jgi:PleD family two-component response regulator
MKEMLRHMRPDTTTPTRLSPSSEPWDDAVMSAPPLRVMLVDDHQVVRDGIRLLLNEATDVVICAEAAAYLARHTTLPGA